MDIEEAKIVLVAEWLKRHENNNMHRTIELLFQAGYTREQIAAGFKRYLSDELPF